MPRPINRIGILTGGGDCPGINAVLRALTKTAIYQHGLSVIGIEDGFLGLIENRLRELSAEHVSGILTLGGTILGTNNRVNPTRHPTGADEHGRPIFSDVTGRCLEVIAAAKLEALIIVGGDGTMSCAAPFVNAGINCIGVPKTIDNDVAGTDLAFGFLTAVQTAAGALDNLHSTAASHHRVMVCEVMGRNAGWLALHSGLASGSDVILMPEIPFSLDEVCRFVESRRARPSGFSIIACAEGARPAGGKQIVDRIDPGSADPIRLGGIGTWLADQIAARTGLETRTTVLGHVQRGGSPVAADRVLATALGHHAIEILVTGGAAKANRMVAITNGRLGDVPITDAMNKQRLVGPDDPALAAARAVRTCFGD